jgi:hypothetical protein
MAADPLGVGDVYDVIGVQRPAEIVNYESTGDTPAVLAAGLAGGALVALCLTLIASVRRRRRDLALLKTLGFTRRQLAGAVGWQASVAALVGVVIGAPIGVAAGQWLWDVFARNIYAVPEPSVPFVQIGLVVVAALVLANLMAAIPGRIAARTPTALVLRAEQGAPHLNHELVRIEIDRVQQVFNDGPRFVCRGFVPVPRKTSPQVGGSFVSS